MWYAIDKVGINGAALVWLFRMVVDAGLLFFFAKKKAFEYKFKFNYLLVLIIIAASIFPILVNSISLKFILTSVILLSFLFISWKVILIEEERVFFLSRIKIFNFIKF